MHTDSTRSNSKRVSKFSLLNESIIKDEIPSTSYRVGLVTKNKGADKRISTIEDPSCFRSQNHITPIFYSLDGTFRSMYFQDEPKISLSFET